MTTTFDKKVTDKTAPFLAIIDTLTTFEELDFVSRAIRRRRDYMADIAKEILEVGMSVKFFDKHNREVRGIITKIMSKNVKVEQPRDGRSPMVWTVYPSHLRPIVGELSG